MNIVHTWHKGKISLESPLKYIFSSWWKIILTANQNPSCFKEIKHLMWQMTNCRALLKVGLDAIYHRLLLVIIIMPGVNSKDAFNQRLQLRHLYIYKENSISYKYCAFPSQEFI